MTAIFSVRMFAKSDKATRELGYHPVALSEMLRRCYDWLVAEENFAVQGDTCSESCCAMYAQANES